MTKPKFLTDKFINSACRFAIFFAMLGITPVIGRALAPLTDGLDYGMLRDLFAEVFTVSLWVVEGALFYAIHRILKKRTQRLEHTRTLVVSADDYESVEELSRVAAKQKRPELPWKNVGILTAICAGCILLVSAVIGFQVKPFYDFGTKFTGYERYCTVGRLGRNVFKCIFIAYMLPECKKMAEEVATAYFPEKGAWATWLLAGGILQTFGLFDIFTSVMSYPLDGAQILLGLAYFVAYGGFTAVYCFTNEHAFKSYWLIVLIYFC